MKRSLHIVALAFLALLLLGPIPRSLAKTPEPSLKTAREAAPDLGVAANDAAAYGTGTIIHADALRPAGPLVDLDVAFSGAAFSTAAPSHPLVNEVNRVVAAHLAGDNAHGRGTGLELGVATDHPFPLIGQLAETTAPPSTQLIQRVIGPLGLPGILTVDLLRAQSQSRALPNGCVLGPDQSYGLGSVLNLDVLNGLLTTTARPPLREVSQSASTTRIVPGSTPGRLGLRSETRQTIAPVTFFRGTPAQFTVEVLGEWALRATSDGVKSTVSYGPLAASPETPVLRILGDHGQVMGQLTTQNLLGPKGLQINIPGVAEIAVGEAPRAIGGDYGSNPAINPTQAAAAVDVVRVRLLNGSLADVRVGHMEAAVNVPAGGLQCPGLDVGQTVDKPTVTPGDIFVYTVTVTNPNDCDLTHLKLVETPTASAAGVQFTILSTSLGGQISGDGLTATWPDVGGLGFKATKTFTITVKIPPGSSLGKLTALATATGLCPAAPEPTVDVRPPAPLPLPSSPDDIPVMGSATVDGPTIAICTVPNLAHDTIATAKAALLAAGCVLGTVTDGGPTPNATDIGKVIGQGTPPDSRVPLGTPVDVTVGGPLCDVPNLAGLTTAQATTALTNAHCKLGDVTTGPPGNPADTGKVTTQNPPAGDHLPVGTPVDVTVGGPPATCVVADVSGLTEAQAKAKLEAAGCTLGTVTSGPTDDNPANDGKVTDQGTPPGQQEPPLTPVNVTIGGPNCNVPNVSGMSEADARAKVEAAGCVLATNQQSTTNPADVGKVLAQSPAPGMLVPPGSTVNASVGVQVAGLTELRTPAAAQPAGTAPDLAKTGGVVAGGLALWLLISGLLTQLAGSERLWRLVRRMRG